MANKKEDTNISRYCARALAPYISALNKSAKNILKRNNIEDIHDVRVATRRIRAVLTSFADYLPEKKVKAWRKDIKKITQSYGKVRDLDVQLDLLNDIYEKTTDTKLRSGLRRLKLRLSQKRKKRQENTTARTGQLLQSASIIEMNTWIQATLSQFPKDEIPISLELFQLGYKQIQSCLDDLLFYEVFIFDKRRIDELHLMRISAKSLRYSLEVFSDLYQKKTDFALTIAKQAQEYLGDIHDNDIWIEFLPKFLEEELGRIKEFYGYSSPYRRIRPGIEFLIENRKTEREKQYKAFLKDWKKWKLDETWLNLRKVIFLTNIDSDNPEEISSVSDST